MNGGPHNSEDKSKLNPLESRTDSKEAKAQTEDSKTLKSLSEDKSVATYQPALQVLENGTPLSALNQSLEVTSKSETLEELASTSQPLKSLERELVNQEEQELPVLIFN
jgi:hypothetical protein